MQACARKRLSALQRPHSRAKRRSFRLRLAPGCLGGVKARARLVQRALRRSQRQAKLRDTPVKRRLVRAWCERGEQRRVRGEPGDHRAGDASAAKPAARVVVVVFVFFAVAGGGEGHGDADFDVVSRGTRRGVGGAVRDRRRGD